MPAETQRPRRPSAPGGPGAPRRTSLHPNDRARHYRVQFLSSGQQNLHTVIRIGAGAATAPDAVSPTSHEKHTSPTSRKAPGPQRPQSGAAAPPGPTSPTSRKRHVSLTSRTKAPQVPRQPRSRHAHRHHEPPGRSNTEFPGTAGPARPRTPQVPASTEVSGARSVGCPGQRANPTVPASTEVSGATALRGWPRRRARRHLSKRTHPGPYSRTGPSRRCGPRRAPRPHAPQEHAASQVGRRECSGFIHF